nr:GNAT family N-acetyltransferase [Pseudomonas pohangensis]
MVKYDERFLKLSWEWLNDPEIKALTMTPDFTRLQQLEFYKSLDGRSNYKIFGVMFGAELVGACGLKNIEAEVAELWLYIGVKKYWGIGIGREVVNFLEGEAASIGLKGLYLKVAVSNISAQTLYKKNGFKEVITEAESYLVMEKSFDSISNKV